MYKEVHEDYSPLRRLAFRAIRCANVRFGILLSSPSTAGTQIIERNGFFEVPSCFAICAKLRQCPSPSSP